MTSDKQDTGPLQKWKAIIQSQDTWLRKLVFVLCTPALLYVVAFQRSESYQCPNCGVDLVGHGHNCPECGYAFTEKGELRNIREELERLNDER